MNRSTIASPKHGKSGSTGPAKPLTGADRKKFLVLVDMCSSQNQLTRITGRLRMNKFAMEHGDDVCQATFDAIMARAKKK